MKRGYEKAVQMQKYANRKGGFTASPDGFDRSDPLTLASQIDEWFEWLAERNYSERTVDKHIWSLRSFLRWAARAALDRTAICMNADRLFLPSPAASGVSSDRCSPRRLGNSLLEWSWQSLDNAFAGPGKPAGVRVHI